MEKAPRLKVVQSNCLKRLTHRENVFFKWSCHQDLARFSFQNTEGFSVDTGVYRRNMTWLLVTGYQVEHLVLWAGLYRLFLDISPFICKMLQMKTAFLFALEDYYYYYFIIHLFTCAYIVWVISSPCPPPWKMIIRNKRANNQWESDL
jgi:hypothetical protein